MSACEPSSQAARERHAGQRRDQEAATHRLVRLGGLAAAAAVPGHRLGDRIGRRELRPRRSRRLGRLQVGEERLAEREHRRRIVDGRGALAQRRAAVEAARVPGERLAQLVHAHLLGAVREDQLGVAAPDARALGQRRRAGIGRAPLQRGQRAEEPGVPHRAAPDHHGVAAGLALHARVGGDVLHVAVADDRDLRAAARRARRRSAPSAPGRRIPARACGRER